MLSMPLTPGDQQALREWLSTRLETDPDPIAALQTALETSKLDLVAPPSAEPNEYMAPVPRSTVVVVRDLLSAHGEELSSALRELAEALHVHITQPSTVMLTTHYFVEKWLPLLGSGPGWAVALLRSLSYYNRSTGEMRDELWVNEGFGELARYLGYSRPNTVSEWFRGRGQGRGKVSGAEFLPEFVQLLEQRKGPGQEVGLRLKVRLDEPLTPEDYERYQATLQGSVEADDTIDRERRNAPGTVQDPGSQRAWHGLRTLSPVPDSSKDISSTTTALKSDGYKADGDGSRPVVVGWNLETLLDRLVKDVGVRERLITRNVSSVAFVSWLLYCASPQGRGIVNPVGYAIRQLARAPNIGAGEPYNSLADRGPDFVGREIMRAIEIGNWANDHAWPSALVNASKAKLAILAWQLGFEPPMGTN